MPSSDKKTMCEMHLLTHRFRKGFMAFGSDMAGGRMRKTFIQGGIEGRRIREVEVNQLNHLVHNAPCCFRPACRSFHCNPVSYQMLGNIHSHVAGNARH